MRQIDVFNGDADGLCALHQWRLAYPAEATLVTGVKRRIDLLSGLSGGAGDRLLVLDISFDSNREDAVRLLEAGAEIRWFDHHYCGDLPVFSRFHPVIDPSADVCTSLLVDRALDGRHRPWAIAAAFGDNLHAPAARLARAAGLSEAQQATLAELGELLNYNGYGDAVADLHVAPDALYHALAGFADPFEFVVASPVFARLRAGFAADMTAADDLTPVLTTAAVRAFMLPDAAWARRVVGVLANRLANAAPEQAHALLVPNAAGALTVSVRAPKSSPDGADVLCRQFPSGGGRRAAAGINRLEHAAVDTFLAAFAQAYR